MRHGLQQSKFADQLAALTKAGFTTVHHNLRVLRKFDGDLDKALARLREKQAWAGKREDRGEFKHRLGHCRRGSRKVCLCGHAERVLCVPISLHHSDH